MIAHMGQVRVGKIPVHSRTPCHATALHQPCFVKCLKPRSCPLSRPLRVHWAPCIINHLTRARHITSPTHAPRHVTLPLHLTRARCITPIILLAMSDQRQTRGPGVRSMHPTPRHPTSSYWGMGAMMSLSAHSFKFEFGLIDTAQCSSECLRRRWQKWWRLWSLKPDEAHRRWRWLSGSGGIVSRWRQCFSLSIRFVSLVYCIFINLEHYPFYIVHPTTFQWIFQ